MRKLKLLLIAFSINCIFWVKLCAQNVMAKAGPYTAFEIRFGRLYAWGQGNFGALGTGDNQTREYPT